MTGAEHLKRFPVRMARVEDVDGLGMDLRAVKQHMAALEMSEVNEDADTVSLRSRLERIERRPDLTD